MIDFETIKIFLPKYLSSESFKELLNELKQFPNNIDNRFYSQNLESNVIFQGDGFKDFLIINLPDKEIKTGKVLVFSNTCDIDISNERKFESRICYAPIFDLLKYKKALYQIYKDEEKIINHIDGIKKQEYTQIFYLPQCYNDQAEGIVFLDRIINCNNEYIYRNKISDKRIFSLSNYGWYLFLFKLSVHFTRMHENVDRISTIRGASKY